ncbi:EcoKI restriction-modification system protein HsdS [Thalassovita gelatinovora]|uniref:EcoKI restriction-modification system protein HsdS n=1 Tax=Thalassovita gelatinovora TaxID=53501 RepID=A0A0P1FBZ6_THAGE|nr:restriction endonuclease subunit S [Thalassovita gelatinovora]QIZ80031.1 restriction endonuclease subunit S [Thalassovita gelatinovora]CUH65735.1 EcoKI restriction-modification system protein HsdS [Thalassovita gelatinovora]SER04206.1 type I restriction enzyme, S subunit [Thalassovita gelatinovora]
MNVPALRFPEFEGEWGLSLLDSVTKRRSGHTPDKKQSGYWDGGIKWVSLADSSKLDAGYIYDTDKEISALGVKHSSAVLLPKDTVVMSRDAGVGKSAILAEEMAVSQHFIAWICDDPDHLNNWFLYNWLQIRKGFFERQAVGSTILTIGLPLFKKLKIFHPSLLEQKKIAAFLGVVDAKIAALRARVAGLERYKRGLMQALFSQTLRFTKPDGSAFPDWDSKPFSELAGLSKDRLNPTTSSEKPPLIELENLESNLGSIVGLSDLVGQLSQKTRFRAGEVLFGKLRPYLRKFARPDFDGVCSSEIWVLRGKLLSNAFLFYLVQGSQFNQLANISAGSKMPRSDWKTVAESEFEFPHPDEQAKIAEALSAMDAKIAAVGDQITKMEAFKKGLLQQMFV